MRLSRAAHCSTSSSALTRIIETIQRQQRIIVYVVLTLAGVLITFSNAFLTDLRFGDGSPSEDLGYYGFDWVEKNFLTGFFLTNKIGGALGLLGAGLSGTLAEAEIRSKDENAQMIWLEMQRRKSAKDQPKRSKKKKGRRATSKKDMTGKQKKRLSALEELMVEDNAQSTIEKNESEPITIDPEDDSIKGEGLLDKMKSFYDQADQMAATNALILNKELEDRGVLEKITDETGLKVVGKDAAESKSSDEKKD